MAKSSRHRARWPRSKKQDSSRRISSYATFIGDWGDLCDEDRNENRLSLEQGFRLLSSYRTCAGDTKVWVITEADRSVTTILLPEEY